MKIQASAPRGADVRDGRIRRLVLMAANEAEQIMLANLLEYFQGKRRPFHLKCLGLPIQEGGEVSK